jgi:hypothetical protein
MKVLIIKSQNNKNQPFDFNKYQSKKHLYDHLFRK